MYSQDEILTIAGNAAEIMLKNGGETYRVEEMIDYICKSAGIHFVEPFVTPTGIFISVNNADQPSETTIRRVKERKINLNKVSEVNNFSRKIGSNSLTYREAMQELKDIDKQKNTYHQSITFLAAALTSGFSALFFQGSTADFFPSFFVSLILQVIIFYTHIKDIHFFSDFIGGLLAGTLSIIFLSIGFGEHLDKIIVGAIIPLVPGVAITNGIREVIRGELLAGMTSIFEAFWISVAIASGVAAAFYFFM